MAPKAISLRVCKLSKLFPLLARSSNLPVKLDEHEVPDFKHIWVIHVDQVGGISAANAIIVDLAAGSTWTGVPHLPEIIFHAPWQNTALIHSKTERR